MDESELKRLQEELREMERRSKFLTEQSLADDHFYRRSDKLLEGMQVTISEWQRSHRGLAEKLTLLNGGAISLVLTAAMNLVARGDRTWPVHLYSLFVGIGLLLCSSAGCLWMMFVSPALVLEIKSANLLERQRWLRQDRNFDMKRRAASMDVEVEARMVWDISDHSAPPKRLKTYRSVQRLCICLTFSGFVILTLVFAKALMDASVVFSNQH